MSIFILEKKLPNLFTNTFICSSANWFATYLVIMYNYLQTLGAISLETSYNSGWCEASNPDFDDTIDMCVHFEN